MQSASNKPNKKNPISNISADSGKKAQKVKKGGKAKAFFIGLLIGLLAPVITIIVFVVINGGNILTAVTNFNLESLTAPIMEMASGEVSSNVTNVITIEQYEELEDGMTYKQVTNAIGNKGEVANKEKDTIEYVWIILDEDYPEYTAATITFKGGKLVDKELT